MYGGLFWDAIASGDRMPVGFLDGAGSVFIRFSGANPPGIGAAISGGSASGFDRTYDFSVTVAAVPEPASATLLALGLGIS